MSHNIHTYPILLQAPRLTNTTNVLCHVPDNFASHHILPFTTNIVISHNDNEFDAWRQREDCMETLQNIDNIITQKPFVPEQNAAGGVYLKDTPFHIEKQ